MQPTSSDSVNTDVLHSRGCQFEVSIVLPSGATIALEGIRTTDTVGSLVAKLSLHPELCGHAFYTMYGGSCLKDGLTLQNYNVQAHSKLCVLHRDALPGGVSDAYFATHRESLEAAVASAMSNVLHEEPPNPVSALAQRLAAHSAELLTTITPAVEALALGPPDTSPESTYFESSESVPPTSSAHTPLVLPSLQLEGHVKARGQDNPSYPKRQSVSDELVPWDMPFPNYSPEAWTHGDVLANDREMSTGHKWADPPDVARAGLARRVSYAGDGLPKSLVLHADGKPRNPIGRTGLRGRGLLGKWGPNHAADPIVTRYLPKTGKLQMVAIRRKDTGQWAIPGGMVDDGETVSATLRREFTEEAGNITEDEPRAAFEKQVLTAVSRGLCRHASPVHRLWTSSVSAELRVMIADY